MIKFYYVLISTLGSKVISRKIKKKKENISSNHKNYSQTLIRRSSSIVG